MSLEKEFVEAFTKTWGNILKKEIDNKEENSTMKVTYNGFTGELVKLERTHYGDSRYSLSLYDGDKNVTHSFTHVKLEDVTFSEGVITFGRQEARQRS